MGRARIDKMMIKKYKNNTVFQHLIWLTIIYLISNWFLLVLSGIWWDDWGHYTHDVERLHEVMRQSSLPLEAYIIRSVWWIPNGGYRVVVFFLFYWGSLLLYGTLRRTEIFTEEACFWISALYISVPINDARVTLICYGYSLGLFSFWLACWLVTVWIKKNGKQKLLLRILSIIVLLFSFNTESIMLMTVVILLYLYYVSLLTQTDNWRDRNKLWSKCLQAIVENIDFLLAPIVFYFGKHLLFPAYGAYEGHNYVNWGSLGGILLKAPYYVCITFKNILVNYKPEVSSWSVILSCLIIFSIYFLSKKRKSFKQSNEVIQGEESRLKIFILFILGAVVFSVGCFPYVMVRGHAVNSTSVEGRDSLLLGVGTALLIYYGIKLIITKKIQKLCYMAVIVLGIIHLNVWYMNYQENYYHQLQFQQEVSENKEIQEGNTFLCIFKQPTLCERFYQLNGNAYVATGEKNRFFLMGIDNLQYLVEFPPSFLRGKHMDDYDTDERTLDGIIFINNEALPNKKILLLKIEEIFFKKKFYNWIANNRDIEYISINQEQSDTLIDAYQKGILVEADLLAYIEEN